MLFALWLHYAHIYSSSISLLFLYFFHFYIYIYSFYLSVSSMSISLLCLCFYLHIYSSPICPCVSPKRELERPLHAIHSQPLRKLSRVGAIWPCAQILPAHRAASSVAATWQPSSSPHREALSPADKWPSAAPAMRFDAPPHFGAMISCFYFIIYHMRIYIKIII